MKQYNQMIGKSIFLGKYIQNGKNEEPVAWTVLDSNGSSLLLCSDAIIEASSWDNNADWSTIEWNDSEILKWLNSDFYVSLFSELERTVIEASDCLNKRECDENGLFLLSEEQLEKYLPLLFAPFKGKRTKYVERICASDSCWLRSDYRDPRSAFCFSVKDNGLITEEVHKFVILGVRPAMWVDAMVLESFLPDVLN